MKQLTVIKSHFFDIAMYFSVALFSLMGTLVSLNRYWQYEVFYYDFGIFDQAIWNVSRFKPPIIDHLVVGGKWIFADHFSPSIFLLSPFYWITDRQEVILIFQAAVVGISGIFLYKIGVEVLKNKFLALCVLISYFLFVGLQNAVITDFHESTIMVLPLILVYWAALKNRKYLYWIFLFIALGCKESTFFLGIGLSISLFFIKPEWKKIAITTAIVSIIWGLVSIKIIIPFFSGGFYQYAPNLPDGPGRIISAFWDNAVKRRTLFYSFDSFSFLPLFSPAFWFLIVQDFFIRFIPENTTTRWDLGLHYSAQTAAIMGISSVFAIKNIQKIKKIKKYMFLVGIAVILNALFLYRFVLHGPFALSYNPAFYQHTNSFTFLDNLVKIIPKNATVMAQNNLVSHFTHQKSWMLRLDYEKYRPEYIIIDDREMQNGNNFFGTGNIDAVLKKLQKDKAYEVFYHKDDQYVFKVI